MKIWRKIKSEFENLKLRFSTLFQAQPPHIQYNVLYVSQFAHPEYAERILKKGVPKTSDPNWKETGAESSSEYAEWVLTICGMACTSMILKYFKNKHIGIVSLAKEALEHGVYQRRSDGISSMQYREFSEWISRHGLNAKVYTRLTVKGIVYLLTNGELVIVSVNPNIREYETADNKQKGGHLVLITGYDQSNDTLTLHNPSGFVSHDTQKNYTIPVTQFKRYYARRGIAVSNRG